VIFFPRRGCLLFVYLVLFFEYATGKGDDISLDSAINMAAEAAEKVSAFRLKPGQFFEVRGRDFDTTSPNDIHEGRYFVGRSSQGGIVVNESGSAESWSYSIDFSNPKYFALVSIQTKERIKTLADLKRTGYRMENFGHSKDIDWDSKAKGALPSFHAVRFHHALAKWRGKASEATYQEPSSNNEFLTISFADWPDERSIGARTFGFDPKTFSIRTVDGESTSGKFNVQLSECKILNDVPIPAGYVLKQYLAGSSATGPETCVVNEGTWLEHQAVDLGFVDEQLWLPYYGLPEPDLSKLPPQGNTWVWLIILAVVLVATAALLLRRYSAK
jgi:hypothetical protein